MFTSVAIERGALRKEIAALRQLVYETRRTDPREAKELEEALAEKEARYEALGKASSRG